MTDPDALAPGTDRTAQSGVDQSCAWPPKQVPHRLAQPSRISRQKEDSGSAFRKPNPYRHTARPRCVATKSKRGGPPSVP
jgi:hypothetical protein